MQVMLTLHAGDLMTINLNLAGLPAVTVPCGYAEDAGSRLPVGIQARGALIAGETVLGKGLVPLRALGLPPSHPSQRPAALSSSWQSNHCSLGLPPSHPSQGPAAWS